MAAPSSANISTSSSGGSSGTRRIEDEVVALLDDDNSSEEQQEEARELTRILLGLGKELRDRLVAAKQAAEAAIQQRKGELLRERQALYATGDIRDDYNIITQLRQLSRKLQQLQEVRVEEVPNHLKKLISQNLGRLQNLVGHDNVLPHELRYLADADPDTGVVAFEGGRITDPNGRDVWSEYCATCDIEISLSEPRWRCFVCCEDNVHCVDCQEQWNRHEQCGRGGDLTPLLENLHPVFRRLQITAPCSLAVTVYNMFQAWGDRPCFRGSCSDGWLSYRQVYDKVSRIATLFHDTGASKILLCFPAGSIDFYFADLACTLARITSVGCPMSPPLETMPSGPFVVCPVELRCKLHFNGFGDNVQFLDLESAASLASFQVDSNRQDPKTAVYTEYYTSGSSGVPKRIPATRQEFLSEITISAHCIPGCFLSFLPPYWATDRLAVYRCLYLGYRVGFSRTDPSLEQIVEDIQQIEPTFIVAPTSLLEFLFTIHPLPSLGTQLRNVFCGGSIVGSSVKKFVRDLYGVNCIESYGCTECGGITVEGMISRQVVDVLRLRDPNSGDWLDLQQETPVIGELWVRDFNTKDLVEISDNGKRLRVLGRSGYAASFKLDNGKWCSLVDIEAEIMRTCGKDLVRQVQVMLSAKSLLVLVAVPYNPSIDPTLLLKEIRLRTALPSESKPEAVVLSDAAFPVTQNHKIKRDDVIDSFREAVEKVLPMVDEDLDQEKTRNSMDLASKVLGYEVDPKRSFLENGGDSLSAVRWLQEVKLCSKNSSLDWIELLNFPLESIDFAMPLDGPLDAADGTLPNPEINVESSSGSFAVEELSSGTLALDGGLDGITLPRAPTEHPTANHILLTGATGFLGRHVLKELLDMTAEDTIIVCLIRSIPLCLESDRVLAVTNIPLDISYRLVIHLAAHVDHIRSYEVLYNDNVKLTRDLLRLNVAPMLFCSTSSTRHGQPPFPDGYTQSKYVSEQMVLKCGGRCVWPPFLLWGNKKDWLTRLIQHCIDTGTYPTELGYLPSARVVTCAKEILAGGPCSTWDLDLHDLFTHIMLRIPLRAVQLSVFRANAARNPSCALYPVLPLLQGEQIGSTRSQGLDLFPLKATDIKSLLESIS